MARQVSRFPIALLSSKIKRLRHFLQLLIETHERFVRVIYTVTRIDRTSFDSSFLVVLPRGSHPFPSRTRKLSLAGPMILRW